MSEKVSAFDVMGVAGRWMGWRCFCSFCCVPFIQGAGELKELGPAKERLQGCCLLLYMLPLMLSVVRWFVGESERCCILHPTSVRNSEMWGRDGSGLM